MRAVEFLIETQLGVGQVLDLTRNWNNFFRLHGRVKEIYPNGKVDLEIITAEPQAGLRTKLHAGDVVKLNGHYLKSAPIIGQ
jgi:hypothetical protein